MHRFTGMPRASLSSLTILERFTTIEAGEGVTPTVHPESLNERSNV